MTLTSEKDPWLVPLRGLNEFVYCPRLFHLMYIQGLFEDSLESLDGRIKHEKRLAKSKAGTGTKQEMQGDDEPRETPWRNDLVRKLTLTSVPLSITGKFDVVMEAGEALAPVEVKHGPAPEGESPFKIGPCLLSSVAWDNDQIQLAGQMALLRHSGYHCDKGRLYYQKTKTLVEIPWSVELEKALEWVAGEAQKAASQPQPPPLIDSNKCIRCSLNYICLPDETQCLNNQLEEPRQLFPGRDDCGLLHIITPGSRIGKTGEALKILVPGDTESHHPIKDVAHICCWGPVQMTTQAMMEVADRGIGISWLTTGGWLKAQTTAPLTKNVQLRRQQYQTCDQPSRCLQLARWIVQAKIENQRILIRRNGEKEQTTRLLATLKNSYDEAGRATSLEQLRGIEGYAAKQYWEKFPHLLVGKSNPPLEMNGRNRRPPKDPINTLLSYGYTMLVRDFTTALHGVGLDPMYGFYHQLVPGRPALALDLMEAFRPLVVDSAVLRTVNEGTFSTNDFTQIPGFCTLKPNSKRKWIQAYERRVDEMVTHPLFGYRLCYRRIFTLEARIFGRHLMGEFDEYHPLTTR